MAARARKESAQPRQRLCDRAAARPALLRQPRAQAADPPRRGPRDAGERRTRDPLLARLGREHRCGSHQDRDRARGAGLCAQAPHAPRRCAIPDAGSRPRSSLPTACMRDAGFKLPPDAEAWDGISVEQAYDRLPEPQEGGGARERQPAIGRRRQCRRRSATRQLTMTTPAAITMTANRSSRSLDADDEDDPQADDDGAAGHGGSAD